MTEQEKHIQQIQEIWIKRKEDEDFWLQFQGMATELAKGINSSDSHFIYEIIQNAEDTISHEMEHTLEFIIQKTGLLILNNETGFNHKQIEAICAYKKSTKSTEKDSGYIGEKGIGFKSVFNITDKPAISSNGYRFYFKDHDSKAMTEYVIPYWIDDNALEEYPEEFQRNSHTALYLPFKDKQKIEHLKKDIKDIEPIVILFLKKLTHIKIIENETLLIHTQKTDIYDEGIHLTTIDNRQSSEKYYVFRKILEVDPTLDEIKNDTGRRQWKDENNVKRWVKKEKLSLLFLTKTTKLKKIDYLHSCQLNCTLN